jgi:hypothetical protein
MSPGVKRNEPPDHSYIVLRDRALSVARSAIGIAEPSPDSPAWGILMEMVVPNRAVVATLFCVADGIARMYIGNGGVYIGGGEHERIRQAAIDFLATANKLHERMKPAQSSPLPEPDRVTFYARTDAGLLAAEADHSDLASGLHPLSRLYVAGNAVVGQFRKSLEAQQSGGA